jgi:hypothetical protein
MLRLLAALLLAASAAGALAQTYRWRDGEGRVHYGDTPPANARELRALDAERSTLSVVPGLSKEDLDASRRRAEQNRLERLERELSELRERPAPAPTTVVVPAADTAAPVLLYPVRPPPHWPVQPPIYPPLRPPVKPTPEQQPPMPPTTSVSVTGPRR